MTDQRFALRATVSTERPEVVAPVLKRELPGASIRPTTDPKEFAIEVELYGPSAKELNRRLL
ncbi:MAG: hypothetical protein ACREC5_01585, partial [Thermoplasmata archaeon]